MSSVLSTTDVGTMSFALYNMRQTQQTVDNLTAQASSGYVSSNYAGLGTSAGAALDLTSELAANATLQANTQTASTIQQVTQTALGQIQTLVSGVSAQLLSVTNASSAALNTVSASATAALTQIAGLLDTKVGDTYIFAGQGQFQSAGAGPIDAVILGLRHGHSECHRRAFDKHRLCRAGATTDGGSPRRNLAVFRDARGVQPAIQRGSWRRHQRAGRDAC